VLIGYLCPHRSDEADHAAQRRALTEVGCEQIVEEWPDAGEHDRQPELDALLARLRAGDVVVVPRLDSLGRGATGLVRKVQDLATAGVGLRSLAETIDIPAPRGKAAVAAVNGLPARDGQGAPRLTATDRPAAATRHRTGGRPPKLSHEQRVEIAAAVLSDRGTAADMARRYKVSEATISRLLAATRVNGPAPSASGPAGKSAGHADRIAGVLPASTLDERLAIVGMSGSGKPSTS